MTSRSEVLSEVTREMSTTQSELSRLSGVRQPSISQSEPTGTDIARMADLAERYADLRLGGTDASLIAIAERLGIDRIATFDRRHFTVVRPAHVEAFTLLPDDAST